jgi:hypothetical protein
MKAPNGWTLIVANTGEPARIGTQYETGKGETVELMGGRPPHKPSSTGRVFVEAFDGHSHGYFPSVIGMKWEHSA